MAKHRTSIPEKLAANVRWLSENTCCICTEPEKDIQLHHIDGNPTNHSVENLAVLCLQCHDKTHKKGGVTRAMNPDFITLCRDKWVEAVAWRRDEANKKYVERRVGKNSKSEQPKARQRNKVRHREPAEFPYAYIKSLPKFKSELLREIKKQKSGGNTGDIIEANDHYAKALKGILVTLAAFYSPEWFKDQSPQEFFSEIISARDQFHSIIVESHGPNTGGTIKYIGHGLRRIQDIEYLIEAMIYGLLYPKGAYDDLDYDDWLELWRNSDMCQL